VGVEPGGTGFRPLRVTEPCHESPQVLSIRLEADDHGGLPPPRPGQYLTLRIPGAGEPTLLRSYSLSGDPAGGDYRISVKREDHGLVSRRLHAHIEVGSVIEAAAPRGEFFLTDGDGPVVLISAGIGITPVRAMLHKLSAGRSSREIWWLHVTRNHENQAFAAEVATLPHNS
jgi:ferredoxin-NADP reductase